MKISATIAGLIMLSALLMTPVAHATIYTVTVTLTAPGGRVIWTLTTRVETNDSTLVLKVPQKLYDLIVSVLGADTFTTPFSASLPGGLTLSVSSVPSGLTIVYKTVPPGEVVLDGRVDIFDAAALAFSYGVGPGASSYNSYADVNIDGRVDILDAAVVAINYGQVF